ncbi:MAG: phosphate signaling complex protein PhoU [Phycisphaeraceae bacterium]|nr:phosphate signaling complex protein PhoU [Phycisphaeraceae bacterium]
MAVDRRLRQLQDDLVTQGERVYELVLRAVESAFDIDVVKARAVIDSDRLIDRVDVEIERASIPILMTGGLTEKQIRSVLTIVKINNELERIADCCVNVAEVVQDHESEITMPFPATFRVMANSVVGMMRDANRALADRNVELARQVLSFDDTVDRFKREIGLDAEHRVASGEYAVGYAFRLRTIVSQFERMADHCTNICEQVIYLETGMVVRHEAGGWTDPELPTS